MKYPESIRPFLPLGTTPDEADMREALYVAWKNENASEFNFRLKVARDFFEERGLPDWWVCACEWEPHSTRAKDPKSWWQWRVWLTPEAVAGARWTTNSANIKGTKHNRKFWLCWPAEWIRIPSGFVRVGEKFTNVTARGYDASTIKPHPSNPKKMIAEYWNPDGWKVTIGPKQTQYSTAIETKLGSLGWTALFMPRDYAQKQLPLNVKKEKQKDLIARTPSMFEE
jgi:hypothetical protein